MAEREALKREIEELQNLINDYKNTKGNVPSSSDQWDQARWGSRRGRSYGSLDTRSYSALPQPHVPSAAGSWRKTYSLSNKTNRAIGRYVSHPPQSYLNQPSHHSSTTSRASENNTRLVGGKETILDEQTKVKSTASSLNVQNATSQVRNVVLAASGKRNVLMSAIGKTGHGESPNNYMTDSIAPLEQQSECENKIKPDLKSPEAVTNPSIPSPLKQKPETQLQVKQSLPSAALSNRTVKMPAANKYSSQASSATYLQFQASSSPTKLQLKPDSTQTVVASLCHKKSRFTWVKNQEILNTNIKPKPEARPTDTSLSSVSSSSLWAATARRVSGSSKRISRKPSISLGAHKTSKYNWVSSSCSSSTAGKSGTSTKPLRKPLSPKSLQMPLRTDQGGLEGPKKLRYPTTSMTVTKKSRTGGASISHDGHVSRCRWKAAGQNATVTASSSTPRSTHKGTVYQWTAYKNGQKGEKGSAWSCRSVHLSAPSTAFSTGAFKLQSRTKIIRRSTNSTPSVERRYNPFVQTLRSPYSLRRRTPTQEKTPTSARRAPSKVLVSFGRHKLRRLSLSAAPLGTPKSGPPSPSLRSLASHRVIKTRYKIDTRRAHAIHHNPSLSYRVKRVQSARILLQNRLRTNSERHWRGRSMRWIGGALYRVSANKLSRTHTTCSPNSRSGEWYSPDVSSTSSLGKTSATRYVASRAVQRSIAIIRQARQKKQTAKQYCMYYNRFGKCNHGDACPYIHDPDKVAICTRFLRGTCKQTDGTCSFSHKVVKEKMPVCSYFLKGICNNSSCPYSHVYVSRKAAVCKDFVRGYCPQGDKLWMIKARQWMLSVKQGTNGCLKKKGPKCSSEMGWNWNRLNSSGEGFSKLDQLAMSVCKKKHTLVCPEFSTTGVCPRGSNCKLHHRQSVKRTGSNTSSGPAKRARTRDILKRSEEGNSLPAESKQAYEGSSSSGPEKLLSYISLSSSPDIAEISEAPEFPSTTGPQAKGKTLHIKPRF
ncbi:zinc finger CCCH domain-containing protein 3-like [Myxocyprinus asiaticus]|uniref:zinc finger CCCH domain-containing protein 3-like n=1 Tax=Myxocyprinus asiaticus TaxID=70543 RepID=UPI002223C914|nr:zinc finger CCCH domain-containing protein 3-like [Myxocyprinus asiaticus]